MSNIRQHKVWVFWLITAIFTLIVGAPSLGYLHKNMSEKAISQNHLQKELSTSLRQLREDAQMAQQLSRTIDEAQASSILAPVDRSKVAVMLEQQAAGADLSKFVYSIAPEKPVTDSAITSTTKKLVSSFIDLQAEAPEDISIYRFISSIQKNIPGRARLQQLQISRVTQNTNVALGAANVKMVAKIEWLSNSSVEEKP